MNCLKSGENGWVFIKMQTIELTPLPFLPLSLIIFPFQTQLFDGLEEEDQDSCFGGNDSFVPRRSIKKLVIKNGSGLNNSSLSASYNSSTAGSRLLRQAGSEEPVDPRSPIMNSTKYPDRYGDFFQAMNENLWY